VLPGAGPADHPGAPEGAHESPGALHVHSSFSWDGHGEVEAIAGAARAAGLAWIGMTDHDTLGARYAGFEGLREGVHVVVGYEWSPHGGDHALMYGEDEALPQTIANTIPPAEAIRIVTASGGMAFVAHPDEERSALRSLPPLPWHDWSIRGFTGIELWNYMSEWAEHLTTWNAPHHVLRPGARMRGPTARTLAWWDELNRPRSGGGFVGGPHLTVGVSGVDAHGEGVRFLGRRWTVFPYARVFRTFTNVLLLDRPLPAKPLAARTAILAAIRDGHVLFADRTCGDPLGTRYEAWLPSRRLGIGGRGVLPASGVAELRVRLPLDADIHLLRDGERIAQAQGRGLVAAAAEPGAYRVEARRSGREWLFTNPIVLART